IDLSSNDYLGLADDPRLISRMIEGVKREGCGSTGSRLLRGEREIFGKVETKFARFKGTERSLFFGSGYHANIGVLSTFLQEGDVIFSDELNHASLIDGMRLSKAERVIYPHADVSVLADQIRETRYDGQRFLVSESVFGMDGTRAPLRDLARICRTNNIALIIDEAHAVGLYGRDGSGLIEESGIAENVFMSINPAGKALGVGGAFVAGPAWTIEYLVQRARSFIFSTAPPPSMAEALECALDIIEQEPQRRQLVQENAAKLRGLLHSRGIQISPFSDTQIIPVLIGDSARSVAVAEHLQKEGFDVRAIRPPTIPAGTARLRISVSIRLTDSQAVLFADQLKKALEFTYCAAQS
ncbi:MAG: aminotransferase class I/II-fold pyridoxal phosphate-dependent enzyme, partial [Pyrinomonadaceae bacterium]